MGEMHRRLQEAAIGVSGREENSLSPTTQKNDNDNAIRKIVNKPEGFSVFPERGQRIGQPHPSRTA